MKGRHRTTCQVSVASETFEACILAFVRLVAEPYQKFLPRRPKVLKNPNGLAWSALKGLQGILSK